MVRLPDFAHYFLLFRKHIGRRLYFAFLLTLLAGVTEGIGIALLLPLVRLMDDSSPSGLQMEEGEASALTQRLEDLLTWLGIQDSLAGILILIAAVFAVKGVIKFAEGGYKNYLQADLMRELRAKLFDAYASMDYGHYSRHHTGHFINLLNVQVHSLVTAFDRYGRFMTAVITVVMYFAFALLISWRFASTAVVAGAIILLLFRKLNDHVRALSRKTAVENGTLNHFLVQTMQAFKYISATAQIRPLRESAMKSIYRLTGYMRDQGVAQALTQALNEPLSVAVLVIVIIIQVSVLKAPLAPIIVSLVLIYRAMNQLVTLQVNWLAAMKNIGSLEAVEMEFSQLVGARQSSGPVKLAPFNDAIELQRVSFSYSVEDSRPVLNDVSLAIRANTSVALVGESGAGKSTLVDLLTLMLRPTEGKLLIDGVTHEDIDVESWRQQIGYVSQETVVFDDTIANNICLWRGDYATDPAVRAQVEQAAERAYARQFIDAMPEGFNTRVGDRGVRLSGGQRQRLFIARELYKNPRLLILDEATSALDSESESVIKRTIEQLKGTTTIVMIAHRLSTISAADELYVLDKGRIVERGTYSELIGCEGSFKRMVSLQKL